MERVLDRKPMVSMPAEVSYSFPGRKRVEAVIFSAVIKSVSAGTVSAADLIV